MPRSLDPQEVELIDRMIGGRKRCELTLTQQEEVELTAAMRAGSQEARDRLLASMFLWAARIAIRHTGHGIPFDDLLQEAVLGVLECLTRFDPARARLSTYAAITIGSRIKYMKRHWWRNGADDPDSAMGWVLDASESAEEVACRREEIERCRRLLSCCPRRRSREIVSRRALGETLQAIGKSLGISPQRVSQIEQQTYEYLAAVA